jgi:hypothetical protein
MTIMTKNAGLDIVVNGEDVKLDDHALYMKLYKDILDTYENLPSFDAIQEDITKAINISKKRNICPICEGCGMVNGLRCIGINCLGRGYLSY